jgi:hypothetical protein
VERRRIKQLAGRQTGTSFDEELTLPWTKHSLRLVSRPSESVLEPSPADALAQDPLTPEAKGGKERARGVQSDVKRGGLIMPSILLDPNSAPELL